MSRKRTSDGKQFTLELDRLSEADRKWIEEKLAKVTPMTEPFAKYLSGEWVLAEHDGLPFAIFGAADLDGDQSIVDPVRPGVVSYPLMKQERFGTAVIVGGIAVIGWLLLIGMRLLAYSLFPTLKLLPEASSITDKSPVAAAFTPIIFLHGIIPGFVLGSVLGAAAAFLLPQRKLALLMLPAVIVFIGDAISQRISIIPDYLIQRDWNWLLTNFLPIWLAFFLAAISAAVIVKKLMASNRCAQVIGFDAHDLSHE